MDIKANSWPFIEARNLLNKINHKTPKKGYVLFETGYGPSGLPHIGTFGEVARTSMVIKAFNELAPNIPTKLICFSDDLDGLRKIPDNIPNKDGLIKELGKPLTAVSDPFSSFDSYGENMNHRLKEFLNKFCFKYEFYSSTKCYKTGIFNKTLEKIILNYEEINNLIKSTLREERAKEYSIIMPICPKSGQILESGVISVNKENFHVKFYDSEGNIQEKYIGDGNCKLQWKADFGMRWSALEVDYEMYGKDIIPSAELAKKISKIISKKSPLNFHYELFLDDIGQKISKSKGNGLSMEEWLRYAPHQSLSYYMFLKPKTAKRLFFDIIPKATDEYITFLNKFPSLEKNKQYESPIFFIENNQTEKTDLGNITFALLLNLASACNPESSDILWGFISKYNEKLNKKTAPLLDELTTYAINYYNDFVKPNKTYKIPNVDEQTAIIDLKKELKKIHASSTASEIQSLAYDIGKKHEFDLKIWFQTLYQVLFGQDQGPRIGSFIEIFSIDNMIKLIDEKVSET